MSLGLKRGIVQLEPHDKRWDEAAIQTIKMCIRDSMSGDSYGIILNTEDYCAIYPNVSDGEPNDYGIMSVSYTHLDVYKRQGLL